MRHRVDVMHGVNFDVLGSRNADHYGGLNYSQLEVRVGETRSDVEVRRPRRAMAV